MATFARVAIDYWTEPHCAGETLYADADFSLVVGDTQTDELRVSTFTWADGRCAAAVRANVAAGLTGLPGVRTEAGFRALLAGAGVALDETCHVFFIPTEGRATVEAEPDLPSIRVLGPDAAAAFAAFEAANTREDLDEAYVELDQWVVMGACEGDEILATAGMYPWRKSTLADIGIVTRPDARGRGLARGLVRAISRIAYDRGYEPQYRCDPVNTASRAVAESCGFALYGTWQPIKQSAP